MVDLETLGSVPGCSILSIGAIAFDREGLAKQHFYAVVSRASCARAGLHEDEATLEWWTKQSAAAQVVLAEADETTPEGASALPLNKVLLLLNGYLMKEAGSDVKLWGNGADFDNAILAAAYRAVDLRPAWKFWNNRCYRTLKNMRPDIPIQRAGLHHNALDDAVAQALHAVRLIAA